MKIVITGMAGKRKQMEELDRAARFFARQLMDPRMVRNLEIDLEVWKGLDVEGECVDEDGLVRNTAALTSSVLVRPWPSPQPLWRVLQPASSRTLRRLLRARAMKLWLCRVRLR